MFRALWSITTNLAQKSGAVFNLHSNSYFFPGLTLCQKELAQIAGAFVRLVTYNRSVFGEIYTEIIENHVLFQPNSTGGQATEETKKQEE